MNSISHNNSYSYRFFSLFVLAFLFISIACFAKSSKGSNHHELINLGSPLHNIGKKLSSKGVYFNIWDFNQLFGTVSGGREHGDTYGGQFDLTATLDLNKMFRGNAGVITATIDRHYGKLANIGTRYTGATLIGSDIGGPGTIKQEDTYRLSELTYSHRFLNNKLWVLLGKTQPTFLFNLRDYSLGFESDNIVFGAPQTLFNKGAGAWPVSEWGGVFRIMPKKNIYFQSGVFESANYTDPDEHNLNFGLKGSHGVYVPVEMGIKTDINGLSGKYSIGGFYDTGRSSPPSFLMDNSNHSAIYIHGKQKIWVPKNQSSRGISIFGQAGWATGGRTNFIKNAYTIGFIDNGPFASRPKDSIGLAATYERLGSHEVAYRNSKAYSTTHLKNHESSFDIYYNAYLGSGINVRPFAQYYMHPDQIFNQNVINSDKNATVVGLNITLNLSTALGLPQYSQEVFRP